MVEGAISGALSLAAVNVVRSWPEDLLPRMRLLGEMFAVMRARTRASQRLHEARVEAGQYRERLAHLVRVHTVGEMSTSIAHEINQPLVAIENYALAARRRLSSSGTIDTSTGGGIAGQDRGASGARRRCSEAPALHAEEARTADDRAGPRPTGFRHGEAGGNRRAGRRIPMSRSLSPQTCRLSWPTKSRSSRSC